MIKVLRCRFQQCLDPFTLLLVDGSSETGLFRHLSNLAFGVQNFGNTKSMRIHLFFAKCSRSNVDFKKAAKNWEQVFCFLDNCISIGIVKFSL